MIVVHGIEELGRGHSRLYVTLGVFDGLHRGHLYLLDHLTRTAAARGATPAVITFDHHPDEIITGTAPPLLCDPEERLERLAAAGIGLTVVHHFDEATRRTAYDTFVRRIADRTELAGILMTPESAFGYERHGTPDAVTALGRAMGYEVAVVPTLTVEGRPIRSTDIRARIAAGDLDAAAGLLGRPYAVVGSAAEAPSPPRREQRPGSAVRLEFAMPVALPPAGAYPARVLELPPGRSDEGTATAIVDEAGGLRLVDLEPASRASRIRAAFARSPNRLLPSVGS